MVRSAKHSHYEVKLFLLIVSSEQGGSEKKLAHQTPEAPHINSTAILGAQNDFRCPVEPGLDIEEVGLVGEHARAEVDEFDAHF